jgi:hypothetical protein
MGIFVQCKGKNQDKKNTGAKDQCIEGLMIRTAVAIPGFKFDSREDVLDLDKWNEAVAAKQLFPLYDAEEVTTANTEPTYFEGRSRQYLTAEGKKITTFTSILGLCSHSALKSFGNTELKLFEFTEDGAIKGVNTDDGGVTGQSVTLTVGPRLDATADRPPSTLVNINYLDKDEFEDNGYVGRPSWRASELYGIFDATLTQVSASATVIRLTVGVGCAGTDELIETLVLANFVVKDLAGDVVVVTLTAADPDGIYTLTGTAFASGFTVSLAGVVTEGDMSYESPEPLVIVVT